MLHHVNRKAGGTRLFEGLSPQEAVSSISESHGDDDDDDDSTLTVLTDRSGYSESSDSDSEEEIKTLHEKRKNLEASFLLRVKMLKRVSKGKNPAYVQLLQEYEQEVRKAELEQLLSSEANNAKRDKLKKLISRSEELFYRNISAQPIPEKRKGFGRRLYDTLLFEMNTTVPAVFSLLIHGIAHAAIYECITVIVDRLRRYLGHWDKTIIDVYIYASLLVIGVCLLRLSGYLYWWLSDQDYDCAKLAFHNRARLGMLDALSMLWVKQNDALRAALFIIGYYFCYIFATQIQSLLFIFFDESESLLEDLPSRKYEIGFCSADPPHESQSPYPFFCHDQIERYLEEAEELKRADEYHTWSVLAAGYYDEYWSYRNMYGAGEPTVLLGPFKFFLCYAVTIVLSIGLLYKVSADVDTS